MRAQVVLPTPRGPQNKNACANWLLRMAFFNVVVICSCPTTVEKFWGLYLRAETINLSIPGDEVKKRFFNRRTKQCKKVFVDKNNRQNLTSLYVKTSMKEGKTCQVY